MNHNLLLLSLFGILACFIAGTVGRVAIINGEEVKGDKFTFLVSLMVRNNKNKCGGGIIGDQHILTAAHCIVQLNGQFTNDRIAVLAGTTSLRETKQVVIGQVHKMYVPEDFVADVAITPGDIAVLKLKKPLDLAKHPHLHRLELPKNKHEDYNGKTAVIAGFGWDWIKIVDKKEHGGRTDGHLRYAEVDVLAPGHRHYFPHTIAGRQLTARVKQRDSKTSGVCLGDSGGPLVHGNTVIGILSVSPDGCSEEDYGALYSRVSNYLKFIDDAIHDRTENMHSHELPA